MKERQRQVTLDKIEVILLNAFDARANRMAGRLTCMLTACLATFLAISHLVAAEKPLPKHFYQPLVMEPPRVGAAQ